MPTGVAPTGPDTFPRLLAHHAQVRGAHPAIREKNLGIWQTWTWAEMAAEVRALACGLAAQGFRRGMHLAIIGDNRPRLYWAMAAAQALGGIPVPMYQDAPAAEFIYVLNDAEIAYAIVEDQEQVDKMLEAAPQVQTLAHIYYDDPRGLRNYEGVMSFAALQAQGREYDARSSRLLRGRGREGRFRRRLGDALHVGDDGQAERCVPDARRFHRRREGRLRLRRPHRRRQHSFLSPDGVGGRPSLFVRADVRRGIHDQLPGIRRHRAHRPARDRPDVLLRSAARLREPADAGDDTDGGRGRGEALAVPEFTVVARRCGAEILAGRPVSTLDRLLYAIGNVLVYAPLRNVLGMSRIRIAYTAGAAIGPDLFRFYRSIGVNLKQLYGSTETCAYVCLQPDGDVKLDTVGLPAPGVELKIADSGEVLVRGPMLLKEYYKRPDATAESIDAHGYFHTGDAGIIDEGGHLKIIDRAKDVGRLAGGAMYAPNYIENKLKFFAHVKEAVAFGDRRDTVCAFINIDMGSVGNWAERRNLAYSGYTDLAGKPEVRALIKECVEQVNAELAADAMLSASQVHRFLILHKELDPDDDELTRTRKVRRGFVAEKYAVLIDALYGGRDVQHIETEVKFEDGRRGIVAADLKIVDAKTFPASHARKAA